METPEGEICGRHKTGPYEGAFDDAQIDDGARDWLYSPVSWAPLRCSSDGRQFGSGFRV